MPSRELRCWTRAARCGRWSWLSLGRRSFRECWPGCIFFRPELPAQWRRFPLNKHSSRSMRAVHVITGLNSSAGGPAYTVPRLCKALASNGAHLQLLTVADREPISADQDGYCLRSFGWDYSGTPLLSGVRASSAMLEGLRAAVETADVVHDHGLWRLPNVYAGRAAAGAGKPLVVAPRGMLSPAALSFSRVKKNLFWHLLQKPAITRAACFHATSEQEYRDIRAAGFSQPVAIIPNGIDIPAQPPRQITN